MKYIIYSLIGLGIFAGLIFPQTPLQFGGTVVALFQGGTGTTTAPVSQLLYGGSTAYQSVATTSATCSGALSCTAHTVIGTSAVTFTSSASTFAFPFTVRSYGVSTSTTMGLLNGFLSTASSTVDSNLWITGNVGIGTTSPSSVFQVSAGVSATTTVDFGALDVTSKTCFNVRNNTGAATSFYFVGVTIVIEAKRCL